MSSYTITDEKSNTEASELTLSITIPEEEVWKDRPAVIKAYQGSMELPGFRKGHVPERIIEERLGAQTIWEESADKTLRRLIPDIVAKEAARAVGAPSLQIYKMAPGNPVECSLTIGILEDVKLPDYRSIAAAGNAKREKPETVTDKEVDDVMEELREQSAKRDRNTASEDNDSEKKVGETGNLPEINDVFVKQFGDFENVAAFRKKIMENLAHKKEHKAVEKHRLSLAEAILEKTALSVPKVLIEHELDKMEAEFRGNTERLGLSFDDYIKSIQKSPDDIRNEWRPDAEKRAKLHRILDAIAEEEKLKPDPERLEQETKMLLDHYQGADADRARTYIKHILTTEKVLEFLEGAK